jgi:hypothetical protein
VSDIFSAAWCQRVNDRLVELPLGPGGSGVVGLVITGGEPERTVATWVVDDGRLVSISVDGGPDVEVTVPVSRVHAEAMVSGGLDPAAAYMRGDLKPEGSSRAWFSWLSALARDDVRDALSS